MKKRCEKGKSCGATCISKLKICRKELGSTSKDLSQSRDLIESRDVAAKPVSQPVELAKLESAEDFLSILREGTSSPYSYWDASRKVGDILDPENWSLKEKDKTEVEEAKRLNRKLEKELEGKGTSVNEALTAIEKFTHSSYDGVRTVQKGAMSEYLLKDREFDHVFNLNSNRERSKERVKKLVGEIKEIQKSNPDSPKLPDLLKDLKGEQRALKEYYPPLSKYERRFLKKKLELIKSMEDEYGPMGKSLESVLRSETLREYRVPVEKYRGIRVDDETLDGFITLAQYKHSIPVQAASSWSNSLEVAAFNFAGVNKIGKPNSVIFRAINKEGLPVSSVAFKSEELEILTPAKGSNRFVGYRTINVSIPKQGVFTFHVFDVEEIP